MDYLGGFESPDEPGDPHDVESPDERPADAGHRATHGWVPTPGAEAFGIAALVSAGGAIIGIPSVQSVLFAIGTAQPPSQLRQYVYLVSGNVIFAVVAIVLGVLGWRRTTDEHPRWVTATCAAAVLMGGIMIAVAAAGWILVDTFAPEQSATF